MHTILLPIFIGKNTDKFRVFKKEFEKSEDEKESLEFVRFVLFHEFEIGPIEIDDEHAIYFKRHNVTALSNSYQFGEIKIEGEMNYLVCADFSSLRIETSGLASLSDDPEIDELIPLLIENGWEEEFEFELSDFNYKDDDSDYEDFEEDEGDDDDSDEDFDDDLDSDDDDEDDLDTFDYDDIFDD